MHYICLPGFEEAKTVTLEVVRPDGVVRRYVAPEVKLVDGGLMVPLLGGEAPGRHSVRVRQGSVSATATFMVKPTTEATVAFLTPATKPGLPIKIAVGGLPPNTTMGLHLFYRQDTSGPTGRYFTSFKVSSDRYGQGSLTILTRSNDPEGCYDFRFDEMIRPSYSPSTTCLHLSRYA
jgi:hypothetical protein